MRKKFKIDFNPFYLNNKTYYYIKLDYFKFELKIIHEKVNIRNDNKLIEKYIIIIYTWKHTTICTTIGAVKSTLDSLGKRNK